MDRHHLLRLEDVTKAYPGVVANDHISIDLSPGEIHSIVGENGAGKTTLMSVVYGLHQPDAGRIFVDGELVSIDSPTDALELGIGFVQQHLSLIPTLTVAQNLVLALGSGEFAISLRDGTSKVIELSRQYGLDVAPDAMIMSLGVGQRHRAELLKALARDARILLLDEPNALLTPQEWSELALILRHLADEGNGILLISHKLEAVLEVSDRISILRRGRLVETVAASETSQARLGELMVGELAVGNPTTKGPDGRRNGSIRIEVEGLTVRGDRGGFAIRDVSFAVHEGEILGIAGVEGSGQVELTEALAGARQAESGSIRLDGHDLSSMGIRERAQAGITHVPSDRQAKGLVSALSVAENLTLPVADQNPLSRYGVLNLEAMNDRALELIRRFDVRVPNPDVLAGALSGGNQQKVILASALSGRPNALVCCYPTRGLDFAAALAVRREILDQARDGTAVVFASIELDELLELTDRILVLHNGSVTGEVLASETTAEQLGLLMGGTAA